MWQLATSRQWCRKPSYKTTNQVGNDAASCPTRRRFKSARCRKRDQVWSHTATRSSIIPQKCGSGNDATIIKIKSAMMPQPRQIWSHTASIAQHNPTGVWEWQCHYKDQSRRRWRRKLSYETMNQVGSNAASKVGMMPQSRSAVMPQEKPCMVSYCFHSSIIPQECGSAIDATIKI
jgi:hypothetical protein